MTLRFAIALLTFGCLTMSAAAERLPEHELRQLPDGQLAAPPARPAAHAAVHAAGAGHSVHEYARGTGQRQIAKNRQRKLPGESFTRQFTLPVLRLARRPPPR